MTLPDFYQSATVSQIYAPDLGRAYAAGQAVFQLPASQDNPRLLLFLIDMQVDFVFPTPIGNLPVPNALDDTRRVVEWLYHNVQRVTQIAASLDTHTPYQIFHPSWWKNAEGVHPSPFTVITAEQVQTGVWNPVTEPDWSVQYVQQLEKIGKKKLMIWPFHCIEGTIGRSLVPSLAEAIMYHSGARLAQPTYISKGMIAQTEFYSVIEPEVKYPGHPDEDVNTALLQLIGQFDLIYVAGEARSHCVLETMNSIARYFANQPDILRKIRFLTDCTSSIIGFEEATEARMNEFATYGVNFVRSTDEIG